MDHALLAEVGLARRLELEEAAGRCTAVPTHILRQLKLAFDLTGGSLRKAGLTAVRS